jgi:hypothetical protein
MLLGSLLKCSTAISRNNSAFGQPDGEHLFQSDAICTETMASCFSPQEVAVVLALLMSVGLIAVFGFIMISSVKVKLSLNYSCRTTTRAQF